MEIVRTIFFVSVIAWLLLPTGTPDDIIVITMVTHLGIELYLCLVISLLIFLWYKKITFKKIGSEINKQYKKIIKKVR